MSSSSAPAQAPSNGMSLAEETSMSQLRQRLQRDINGLSDQDRTTRRRALTKLQQVFFRESKGPEPAVMRAFFARYLSERLVAMLADPVEKCREVAGGLLMAFVDATDDVPIESAALANRVFAMAETRIGAVPLLEPAEEIRAILLCLCRAVLARDSAFTFADEVGEQACAVLSAALTDPFPEVKRECCSLLLRLAAVCPGQLRSRMDKVLKPLIVNLGHQHSKTRQMTLQALGSLLLCGSDDMNKMLRELILPQFKNLLYDRTLAVRRELAGILGNLVEAGLPPGTVENDGRKQGYDRQGGGVLSVGGAGAWGGHATAYLGRFRAELVSLLMSLLSDDSETVVNDAKKLLDKLGEAWGRLHTEEVAEASLAQRQQQQQQLGRNDLGWSTLRTTDVVEADRGQQQQINRTRVRLETAEVAEARREQDQQQEEQRRQQQYQQQLCQSSQTRVGLQAAEAAEARREQQPLQQQQQHQQQQLRQNYQGRDNLRRGEVAEARREQLQQQQGDRQLRGNDQTRGRLQAAEVAEAKREDQHRQQTQTGGQPSESPPPPPLPQASSVVSAAKSGGGGGAAAANALCSSLLDQIMPAAIEDAAHWTVRGRRRAVWLLCHVVRYAGDDVTPFLPELLGSLGEASRDDEAEVRKAVEACAAAIGYAVAELSAVTDVLLPVLRGEVSGHSTPQHLTAALTILCPIVTAAAESRREALAPLIGAICAALSGNTVLNADRGVDEELWLAGMEACRAIVESGLAGELRRPEIRLNLLRTLLWLLAGCRRSSPTGTTAAAAGGVAELEDDEADVTYIANMLAEANGYQDPQELFSRHFSELLGSVLGRAPPAAAVVNRGDGSEASSEVDDGWQKGSPRRAGFEALLRSAPRAVGSHLGQVMPVFRELLYDARREAELRLSMLALLECVLKQREVTEEALRPYAVVLLRDIVVANAVWRAGMVAATVRKVAIAVVYTALRNKKVGVEAVYSSAEQLLPILKTNLEDHEATTRQMACLSLEMMFLMMPGALGEEPVRYIYPDLLKRLDDSNDIVRQAVCGTMSAFFKATAPQNVRGTVLKYSVEQLLVHMDDQDEIMQQAVFEVTKVAARIDADAVVKLAKEVRSSHRSPDYCDRLVAFAISTKEQSQ